MKTKGSHNIKIAAVDLDTCQPTLLESMTAAANYTGVSKNNVRKCYHLAVSKDGWFFCDPAQLEEYAELIRALSARWQQCRPSVMTHANVANKVKLRLDAHTVIWVKPEEANEEFKAKYKTKLLKHSRYAND